ncbi:hypothetical protein Ancab_025168 [Ancistrocladus abbreviatus]
MASPAIQRSPLPSSSTASPLQSLSTFKDRDLSSSSPLPQLPLPSPLTPNPLSSFSSDPIFSLFLSPNFDCVRFSSHALSTGSSASTAEKIQDGIRLLEKELRSEVLSRHDDLFSQLSSLRDAESALAIVRLAVSTLQTSVRGVRSDIADPNRQIRSKTAQLLNIHKTSELLQYTIRVLRLSKKLRDLMTVAESDPKKLDLLKAAQLHCEILGLASDNGLSGIDVIDDELRWVSDAGAKLRSEGMKILERGLEGLNQAEVGSGLQVFYNLGELRTTVDGLISKYKSVGVKSVSAALDMKAISTSSGGSGGGGFGPGGVQRSGTPQIGSSVKAKDVLWQRMNSSMDQLHSIVVVVWHLQRVLSKKRDPFTHVLLFDEVIRDGDPMLTDRVWEAFVRSFASQMKSAFTASSFVKEIFTMGYPKLYSLIENPKTLFPD